MSITQTSGRAFCPLGAFQLRLRAAARGRTPGGSPRNRGRRLLAAARVARIVAGSVVVVGRWRGAPTRRRWCQLHEPAVTKVRAPALTEADRSATIADFHDHRSYYYLLSRYSRA